jgi:hypothetical protein
MAGGGGATGLEVPVAWHSTAVRELAGQAAGKLAAESVAPALRDALAARTTHLVTFGWGPRFLHSTGQYHKGGPQNGTILRITGAVEDDIEVPGRDFTLGELQPAQALGDLGALRERGRPAVRLHLRDRAAGVTQLLNSARASMNGATR